VCGSSMLLFPGERTPIGKNNGKDCIENAVHRTHASERTTKRDSCVQRTYAYERKTVWTAVWLDCTCNDVPVGES
jgi:hypothetical protein